MKAYSYLNEETNTYSIQLNPENDRDTETLKTLSNNKSIDILHTLSETGKGIVIDITTESSSNSLSIQ